MFIDGLWATRMTLHIHRNEAPIPEEMRDEYLTLELSSVQMNAIAAVLGLGYRNGELLYYRDEDVNKNIERTDGFGIQANYHFINCDSRRNRLSKTVNKPLIESSIGGVTKALKTDNGGFDFVIDDAHQVINNSSDETPSEEATKDIMKAASSVLGLSFSVPGMHDNSDGIVDVGEYEDDKSSIADDLSTAFVAPRPDDNKD